MNILYSTSSSFLDSDLPLLKAYSEAGHSVYLIVSIQPNGLKSTVVSISEQYSEEGLFDYRDIYPNEFKIFAEYTGVKRLLILNSLTNSLTFKTVKYHYQIRKFIRDNQIDVHHYIGLPSIMAVPALICAPCKRVVTVHDPVPHDDEALLKLRIMYFAVLKFFRNVILLNTVQTEEFKKYYFVRNTKIYYSRLGNYETLRLFGEKKFSSLRTILFYGRITPYKGVDVLLKAFKKIEKQNTDVKLIVAGKGHFSFDISSYINDPQIEINNDYISLENLCSLIKSCEFSVCPYISATQSGVVASVLALGKPLIVTNVGGLPTMIEEGKSGFVVESNNPDALANAMNMMLNDKNLLDSMYKYISESSLDGKNSWNKIAQNNLRIYNSL